MVGISYTLEISPFATNRLYRVFLDGEYSYCLAVFSCQVNIRKNGRRCRLFYLINPVLYGFLPCLNAMNRSLMINADNNTSSPGICKSGKGLNRFSIETGFKLQPVAFTIGNGPFKILFL